MKPWVLTSTVTLLLASVFYLMRDFTMLKWISIVGVIGVLVDLIVSRQKVRCPKCESDGPLAYNSYLCADCYMAAIRKIKEGGCE